MQKMNKYWNSSKRYKQQLFTLKHWFVFGIVCFFLTSPIKAQTYTQTIQGKVYDVFTGAPLPGVNIAVIKDSIQAGGFTDDNGYFSIENLPIGKYTLKASFIGYKSYSESNLNLTSGRAINIEIRLTESTEELAEVSVSAYESKNRPLNSMALIGARSFTLEETNRYAGSYGDPARMAMNYAGVLPVRDNRNDIIIRGNSASGLQWRLNDIEIPNPNHFGASGTTGGPITIVNANLLSKSDFYNGAFPAEYGNAIAGVFDLKLKSSNLQRHEKWVQLGWNGLEFGIEGPLKKEKLSSYFFSYRHAITSITYALGIDSKERIDYKDLTLKLNFPGTKLGNWTFIGMGGNSRIVLDDRKYSDEERTFSSYGEILDNYTSMGVLGLTNRIYPNEKTKIVNILSVSGNVVKNNIDTFSVAENSPFLWATEDTKEIKYSANTKINYKITSASNITAGVVYDHYVMSFKDVQYINGNYINYTDTTNAQADFLRIYAGYKQTLGLRFESYIGVNGQLFFLNNSKIIEPRASLRFTINKKSDISYGVGLHSQLQPKVVYFVQTENTDGQLEFTNRNLDFTKSIHNVLGYNYLINNNLRIKLELYYQYLFDVPIRITQPEYSLINFGTEYYVERKDSLANLGTGQNYGIEFTFEQFLTRNFFYLFTASLFESNYTSTDNITRSTAYNGRYAINALGGYELAFPKKNVAIIFGINFTFAGGSPYVPFDQENTVKYGRAMFDWKQAYTVQRDVYNRISLRLGIKRNMKKASMETTFDLQYRSDYTSIYQERIDVTTGEIINTNNLGFYPMANVRISF